LTDTEFDGSHPVSVSDLFVSFNAPTYWRGS
jgi:hypothetical protein